ncbi:MAG: ABC transporter permease [Vicinamibacterales bacterium]
MMNWLDQFRRDLLFGVRGLARTPGFTTLAVMSLALGIMATTAIYSVLYAVVLDPFPYKDVDNLMSVRVSNVAMRGYRTNYSVDQFLEIAERNTIFEGTIASTITDVLWTGDGEPQRLRGNYGPFNTFDVMGVPPLLGRTPTPDDARAGAEPVVVLGYRFWQRQLGGETDVLGRRLQLNGTIRTVIGVMPKRFMWRGADVYVPVTFQRGRTIDGVRNVHLLGRLKPGISTARAEADLTPIIADLKRREPTLFPDQWRVGLLPFKETFPSSITRDIWILLGAVALLLLIACANVSNLLLSRATARQREITVRAALGASRHRLVRQLLTESLVLALLAGIVGTALAYAGLPALLTLVPPDTIPDESEIALNMPVLVFSLVISAVTSVLCGLAPALHTSGRDVAQAMREASRSLAGSSKHAVLRKTLVVGEVALSIVLLAGSSVLLRAFMSMRQVDLAVEPAQVLTMRVPLAAAAYPDAARRSAFFQDLIGRVGAVPGVAAAAVNSGLHPLGNMWTIATVAGEPPSDDPVQVHHVSAGYTDVVGIRLAAGRLFTTSDVESAQPVALVNERFVRGRLNGREPLGQTVTLPRLKTPPFSLQNDTFQIVGVVHDSLNEGLTNPVLPEVYLPFTHAGMSNLLVVRTHGDPAPATKAVVSQVYAIDRGQPVTGIMTLDRILQDEQYATPRFNLILLSIFAVVGLALAVVGVYGVMSSAVAQERQEIGVRLALGASAGAIARMVVGRGLRLLLAGTAVGLIGSYAAGRWLAGEVWNVRAFDPAAFTAVSLILLLAGLQACFWPARRAARTDPLVAIREQN